MAFADDESESRATGRFGLVSVGRLNQGELGQQYGYGFLFGVHAGVDLSLGESLWSVGLGWTTLVQGFYVASNESLVDQRVKVSEADVGLRIRRRLSVVPRFLVLTAGGIYSTSNIPIPPNNDRRYLGYYGGLGYEYAVVGEWLLGVQTRYARSPDGPETLSLYLSFVAGL